MAGGLDAGKMGLRWFCESDLSYNQTLDFSGVARFIHTSSSNLHNGAIEVINRGSQAPKCTQYLRDGPYFVWSQAPHSLTIFYVSDYSFMCIWEGNDDGPLQHSSAITEHEKVSSED